MASWHTVSYLTLSRATEVVLLVVNVSIYESIGRIAALSAYKKTAALGISSCKDVIWTCVLLSTNSLVVVLITESVSPINFLVERCTMYCIVALIFYTKCFQCTKKILSNSYPLMSCLNDLKFWDRYTNLYGY